MRPTYILGKFSSTPAYETHLCPQPLCCVTGLGVFSSLSDEEASLFHWHSLNYRRILRAAERRRYALMCVTLYQIRAPRVTDVANCIIGFGLSDWIGSRGLVSTVVLNSEPHTALTVSALETHDGLEVIRFNSELWEARIEFEYFNSGKTTNTGMYF